MLNTVSSKLTATPGESGWAQVHEFAPEDPAKLSLRGRLFAVIATKRIEEGVAAVTAGRELLGRLHEEYYGSSEASSFVVLKSAVEKVAKEFKDSWGDVEIAACALVGDVVYSAAGGGSRVVICREGAMATILESAEGGVISASGYPKPGDTILIATSSLFSKIPTGVIKAGLTSESPAAAIETFAPMVHGEGIPGSLGAVIIRFSGEAVFMEEPQEAKVTLPQAVVPNQAGTWSKKVFGILEKLGKRLPQRGIYIKNNVEDEITSQSKKLTFSVAMVLLLILAVSIGFGVRQKKINDLKSKYQGILSQAEREVDEAIGLASVSPEKSRELFTSSQAKLKEIQAMNVKDARVSELSKKIETSRGAILGEYEISTELFLDLSLLSSGFRGDAISSSGGNIFILDKGGKRIVSVAVENKKSKVVAGPSVIDEAQDMASYEDRAFVLAGDGVYEVGSTKTKLIEKGWGGEALIKAFAGNIYVMDKSGNAIYRFAGSGNTFGSRQDWLSSSTKVDFSDASAWTIDGSIYVLFPNSKIQKFSLGSPQGFSVTGAIPEIGKIDAVYADPDNQYIYLLDRAGKRVVVTDKKGGYKAQYTGGQIGDATNLVVSESLKKIILLTGDKLFSIEIKHL